MTLIAIGYNDENIVIGADSLTTVTVERSRRSGISSEKIFSPSKSAALALSGYFSATSWQFIAEFCRKNKGEKDLATLRNKLLLGVAETLTLDVRENFQLTLVGYDNNKPQ